MERTAAARAGSGNRAVPTRLAPELLQRSLGAIDRIGARGRRLGNGTQRTIMLAFGRMAFVITASRGMAPPDQEVLGGRKPLMAGARWLHDHIAGFQSEAAAARPAEADLRPATGNAQHLMGGGMIVQEIKNPVPPAIAPAMVVKQDFKDRGG